MLITARQARAWARGRAPRRRRGRPSIPPRGIAYGTLTYFQNLASPGIPRFYCAAAYRTERLQKIYTGAVYCSAHRGSIAVLSKNKPRKTVLHQPPKNSKRFNRPKIVYNHSETSDINLNFSLMEREASRLACLTGGTQLGLPRQLAAAVMLINGLE